MKIVQINAVYGVGSTGVLVQDIHNFLEKEGHQSYVFWATKCSGLKDKKNIVRIGNTVDHKIHALADRILHNQGFNSSVSTRILCGKIKKINPDVIHLHNLHSNYINLSVLLKFIAKNNYPLVVTLHDCWFFTGGCMHYLQHNCNRWKDGCSLCEINKSAYKIYAKKNNLFNNITRLAVVGVSNWTMESAKNSLLRCAPIFSYVYNWIDPDVYRIRNSKDYYVDKYGLDKNKKIVLCVAQAWEKGGYKGEDDILYLNKNITGFAQIVMVGKNVNLPKDFGVVFIDYIEDKQELIDLYALADIHVIASKYETFGMTIIESMAMGTPVIAYKNTGAKEVVHESCGVLVEDGNKEELLKAVTTMLNADLNCYKARCKKWVKDNFGIEEQIKKYCLVYKKLNGEKYE